MHVGAALIFEGPPPLLTDVVGHIESRLHLVPRYRQKLAFPPLETGRPVWVDDPDFNVHYHVRHSALPPPGSDEQLRNFIARIVSQQLDRHKPLWEMWFLQGLRDDRWALVSKTHHCMIDGISGVDLTSVLFDLQRTPPKISAPEKPWSPAPPPTGVALATKGLRDLAQEPIRAAHAAAGIARNPRSATRHLTAALQGIGEVAWEMLNPAPTTPLNVEIGPHRRFTWVRCELADTKLIKDALGGTINDVVLAVATGALRRFLHHRAVRTEGLELRALVPVSVRTDEERGQLGNRIVVVRGTLPVYARDPVERLRIVRESMAHVKHSNQAMGAETIVAMNGFMPPTLLAAASRLNFSTRLFNLIVTNVPGPQLPLFFLGHEVESVFPIAFLPRDHALAIAIFSLNGKLNFGILADYDALSDVDVVRDGIESSLAELIQAAERAEK